MILKVNDGVGLLRLQREKPQSEAAPKGKNLFRYTAFVQLYSGQGLP